MASILSTTTSMIQEGKESLESLLREQAWDETAKQLAENGIDIAHVSDEDLEALIAERVLAKKNAIKGFGVGAVGALLFSALIGV